MTKLSQRCGNCFFARKHEEDESEGLYCHYRTPTAYPFPVQNMTGGTTITFHSIWPAVDAAQWCGNWQQHVDGAPGMKYAN